MTTDDFDTHALGAGTDTLAGDLTELYAAPVPPLRFSDVQLSVSHDADAATRTASPRLPSPWRRARPLAVAGALALALGAVVIVPALRGGGGHDASAEEILHRSSGVAATNTLAGSQQSYHIVATHQLLGDPGDPSSKQDMTTSVEIWYADATHKRSDQSSAGPNGVGADALGQALDGQQGWMYHTAAGVTHFVHGDASVFPPFFGSSLEFGYTSLADVLAGYTDDCTSATQQGEDTVQGRRASVIVAMPRGGTCSKGGKTIPKAGSPDGFSQTTIWIDRETFLPLRIESKDNGGRVGYRYQVTRLELGAAISADVFSPRPEPGAIVTEVTAANDVKRALIGVAPGCGDKSPAPDEPSAAGKAEAPGGAGKTRTDC